jgi:hypothetical protein
MLSLAACQAVQGRQQIKTDLQPPASFTTVDTREARMARSNRVVRSEIVPDAPVVMARRQAPVAVGMADALPGEPGVSWPSTDPATAPASPSVTEDGLPLPGADIAASGEPTALLPPPVATASRDPAGLLSGIDPDALLKDPRAALQTTVAGMPLWLVLCFGALALLSLVIGFSGPRERDDPRDEPAFA